MVNRQPAATWGIYFKMEEGYDREGNIMNILFGELSFSSDSATDENSFNFNIKFSAEINQSLLWEKVDHREPRIAAQLAAYPEFNKMLNKYFCASMNCDTREIKIIYKGGLENGE